MSAAKTPGRQCEGSLSSPERLYGGDDQVSIRRTPQLPGGRALPQKRGLACFFSVGASRIVRCMSPTNQQSVLTRPRPTPRSSGPGTGPSSAHGPHALLGRLGQSVVRHRRAVIVFWFLVAIAGVAMVGNITSRLSSSNSL